MRSTAASIRDMNVRRGASGSSPWLRAIVIALAANALLAIALLYVPHWILTFVPWGGRGARVGVATMWMLLATVAMMWLATRASHQATEPS